MILFECNVVRIFLLVWKLKVILLVMFMFVISFWVCCVCLVELYVKLVIRWLFDLMYVWRIWLMCLWGDRKLKDDMVRVFFLVCVGVLIEVIGDVIWMLCLMNIVWVLCVVVLFRVMIGIVELNSIWLCLCRLGLFMLIVCIMIVEFMFG